MRDWIENIEAAAERQYEDATSGLPLGKIRCGCGKVVDESEMVVITPNPWGMAVCRDCQPECPTKGEAP